MKKTQLLKDKVNKRGRWSFITITAAAADMQTQAVGQATYLSVISPQFHVFSLKAMAEESGDGEKVKVIQDELNELEERAEALDRQRTKNISAIRYTSGWKWLNARFL